MLYCMFCLIDLKSTVLNVTDSLTRLTERVQLCSCERESARADGLSPTRLVIFAMCFLLLFNFISVQLRHTFARVVCQLPNIQLPSRQRVIDSAQND